jgi:hypothetical protein
VPNDVPAGTLRFVTYQNLGNLGPEQNEAGTINWRPAARYTLWPLGALFVLLWLIPSANRRRGALGILIPLGVLAAAGWLLDGLANHVDDTGVSDTLSFIGFFCTGWGLLSSSVWLANPWLARPWLTGRARWKTSLTILAAIGLAAGVQGLWMWGDPVQIGAWLACVAVAAVLTLVPSMLAGYNCRRAYYTDRFTALAFGWLVALTVALAVTIAAVLAGSLAWSGVPSREIAEAIAAVLAMSVVAGVFVLLVTFPFWAMIVGSAFYRERLVSLLQMESEPCATTGVVYAGNSPFVARPV